MSIKITRIDEEKVWFVFAVNDELNKDEMYVRYKCDIWYRADENHDTKMDDVLTEELEKLYNEYNER